VSNEQLEYLQAYIIQRFQVIAPRLLEAYGRVEETIKDNDTPVTLLDKQIEEELREFLTQLDPGIGLVGEEYPPAGNTDTFWLIDPIDGTESFIRGIPFARNMVTLIDRGQPIMTVVYKFNTDETFAAIKGQGAYKNGHPLKCSQRVLSRTWIELSVPFTNADTTPMLEEVRKMTNGYRVIGDFTLVLEGKVDAMLAYKSGGGDWDYAPRALLMQEAGAKVANLGSNSYDYKNHDFLAASPAVFDQLMPVIKRFL
jgi:myo-inositol-1(or 4)-monophosphatase